MVLENFLMVLLSPMNLSLCMNFLKKKLQRLMLQLNYTLHNTDYSIVKMFGEHKYLKFEFSLRQLYTSSLQNKSMNFCTEIGMVSW